MDYQVVAQECEEWLRHNDPIDPTKAPAEAMEVYNDNQRDRVSSAIVLHPKYGHVVIATAGQGPFVCWMERNG